ncbi:hypothetical protein IJZ97_05005 [bacterium]|nr:hypothetical protein [bacterium]
MKIQQINQQQLNSKNNNQPQFQGLAEIGNGAVQVLRFLDTNQAWGATAVDFSCMVLPRTMTDFTRGADAGIETLRREASGTVNHAMIGIGYGAFAGWALSFALNNKYGIKAQNIYADSDTVDILSGHRFDVLNQDNDVDAYARKVADSITTADGKLLSDNKEQFIETLAKEIKNPDKENKALMRNFVISDLGIENNILLKSGEKKVKASLNEIIDNVSSFSNALFKEKVTNSFASATSLADVGFLKSIKNYAFKRTALGLAIGSAIGCSIQPFNIYLTKKKTGSDGFVGVEGREKDNSNKFKLMKAGVAAAFGTGVYGLITKDFKPSSFLKNIQYKSLFPTIPQFMLVYGLTIMSRFLVARDKDELREATVKDTLGFLSWLVLGNFVAKGTLKGLNGLHKKLKGIDLDVVGKTRDEVIHGALKNAGIATVEDGKALSFSKLLKKLPANDKLTKTKLRYLTIAQLAGYVFSGVVLGKGIPTLNIHMTKKSEEKRAQLRAMNPANNMLKPDNLAFLSSQMNFTSNKMLND